MLVYPVQNYWKAEPFVKKYNINLRIARTVANNVAAMAANVGRTNSNLIVILPVLAR